MLPAPQARPANAAPLARPDDVARPEPPVFPDRLALSGLRVHPARTGHLAQLARPVTARPGRRALPAQPEQMGPPVQWVSLVRPEPPVRRAQTGSRGRMASVVRLVQPERPAAQETLVNVAPREQLARPETMAYLVYVARPESPV